MRKIHTAVLAALVFAGFAVTSQAVQAETLVCKGGIVSIGDTVGEVLHKCGEPAYKTQREKGYVSQSTTGYREKTFASVTVDDWTYNFGPNEFQYRLLLENGSVSRIESLNYGY
jgi:hypothetical protein